MSDQEHGLERKRDPQAPTRGDARQLATIPDNVPIPPPSLTVNSVRFPAPDGARVDVKFTLPPLPPPSDSSERSIWDEETSVWAATAPIVFTVTIPGTATPFTGQVSEGDADIGFAALRAIRHHTFEINLDNSIPGSFPAGVVQISQTYALSVSEGNRFIGEIEASFSASFPVA